MKKTNGSSRTGLISCLLGLSLLSGNTLACRCQEPTMENAYAKAEVLVRARVTQVIPAPDQAGSTGILSVLEAWKQSVPRVLAVSSLTSCAFPWDENREYFLFLMRDSNGLFSTARCLGNTTADDAGTIIEWLSTQGAPASIHPQQKQATEQ